MSQQIIDEINKIIESLTNLKDLVINRNNDNNLPSVNKLPYTIGRFTVREASPDSSSYRIKGKNGGKTNKLLKYNQVKNKNKTRSTRKR
jgi:hypothetical protein